MVLMDLKRIIMSDKTVLTKDVVSVIRDNVFFVFLGNFVENKLLMCYNQKGR